MNSVTTILCGDDRDVAAGRAFLYGPRSQPQSDRSVYGFDIWSWSRDEGGEPAVQALDLGAHGHAQILPSESGSSDRKTFGPARSTGPSPRGGSDQRQ